SNEPIVSLPQKDATLASFSFPSLPPSLRSPSTAPRATTARNRAAQNLILLSQYLYRILTS
ncbi:MAG TPA: hypothetical protein VI451_10095, partial [Anaerolineales bacterium]|nr:hypothetical protein [Anaerolineales bacterium]